MDISMLVDLIKANGYLIIFILMIIEGPIVTIITSIFSKLGYFNIFLIFILAVLGDIIADTFLFYSNKFDKNNYIKNKLNKKNYGQENIKNHLLKGPFKNLFVIKCIPAISALGIIIYGTLNIKFSKFLLYTTLISMINKSVYILIGYFSGISISYIVSNNEIFNYLVPFIILAVVVFVYFINKIVSKKIRYFE